MRPLFNQAELAGYLQHILTELVDEIETLDEEAFDHDSPNHLEEEFIVRATVGTLSVATNTPVTGNIEEIRLDASRDPRYGGFPGRANFVRGTRIFADYQWEGNGALFDYQPSTFLSVAINAEVLYLDHTVQIAIDLPGDDPPPERVQSELHRILTRIDTMVEYVNQQVMQHNAGVGDAVRSALDGRKSRLAKRSALSKSLGFKLLRRDDAPRIVPVKRKIVGPTRRTRSPAAGRSVQSEWELAESDYEDVISVLSGLLKSCERNPSIVVDKQEEALRDLILIVLNGVYEGRASGETFVQSGKTDILVHVEDRHVFVGECKWWNGPKACSTAVDQLMGYLPWRNEKAALIFFIRNHNATAVIESAAATISEHLSCTRLGPPSPVPDFRRNFILSQPEDSAREIQLAALFAVIR
jgi:hypothetical protein